MGIFFEVDLDITNFYILDLNNFTKLRDQLVNSEDLKQVNQSHLIIAEHIMKNIKPNGIIVQFSAETEYVVFEPSVISNIKLHKIV